MVYFLLDDAFYDHPKVEAASLAAVGAWAIAASYCAKHNTNGYISEQRAAIATRRDKTLAEELVTVGLWEKLDTGYLMHDWQAHNRTKEQVEADRAGSRERQRKHRSRHAVTDGVTTGKGIGEGEGSSYRDSRVSNTVTSRPFSTPMHTAASALRPIDQCPTHPGSPQWNCSGCRADKLVADG